MSFSFFFFFFFFFFPSLSLSLSLSSSFSSRLLTSHLVAVPERAVTASAGAVAVSRVVVEVPAPAAPSRPVAGDRDRPHDDVGDVEPRPPHAAVRVGPAAGPKVGGAVELAAVERAPAIVAPSRDLAVPVLDDLVVRHVAVEAPVVVVVVVACWSWRERRGRRRREGGRRGREEREGA